MKPAACPRSGAAAPGARLAALLLLLLAPAASASRLRSASSGLRAAEGTAEAADAIASAEAVTAQAADAIASAEAVAAEAERQAAGQEQALEERAAGSIQAPAGTKAAASARPALEVKIFRARGLRFSDGREMGVSDPYCVCEIPGKPSAKVQTMALDGLHGVRWNHRGEIAEYAPGDSLKCSIFDDDAAENDKFLGSVVLSSTRLLHGFSGELALAEAGHSRSAYLRLAVRRTGSLQDAAVDGAAAEKSDEAAEDEEGEDEEDDAEDGGDEGDDAEDDEESSGKKAEKF